MSQTALLNNDNSGSGVNGILFGRYMLEDTSEHPCQIISINEDGATVKSSHTPELNSSLVAYIDEIGRVEGKVIEEVSGGFKISFFLNDSRRERIRKKLDWLAQKGDDSELDQRRHMRHVPKDTTSQVVLRDGRSYPCEVLDISISGAGLAIKVLPAIGVELYLGKMLGRVVRHHSTGIAIEFVRQLDKSTLSDQINSN